MPPSDPFLDLSDDAPPGGDPYEALGVERDATAHQIKTAYRKAALKWHPGLSRGYHHDSIEPILIPHYR